MRKWLILILVNTHIFSHYESRFMKKALVLTHVAFENLGNLEAMLKKRNYAIEYVHAPVAEFAQLNPQDPDLLVILGGPIGVYEQDIYPFITDELQFIKDRLNAQLPTLGICLGAQFIALAMGARVYPGNQKEIGWSTLQLTDEGQNSCMKYLDSSLTQVLHWHGDTFDLPHGATLLASTSVYQNQAFAVGNSILGLQFHPEIMPGHIENWLVGHTCELNKGKIDINKLRNDTQTNVEKLNEQAQKFWNVWLNQIEVANTLLKFKNKEIQQ